MNDWHAVYGGRTVAVTGSNGYLGAALVQRLAATGATVVPIYRPAHDVCDPDCWRRLTAETDVIFHLAGNTSVARAAADPDESRRSTLQPIDHLIAAARSANRRPRVVFASTATVYGLTETLPVGEEAEPHPITAYDEHKWCAEQALARATGQRVVDGVALRLSNVYGPSPGTPASADRGVLNAVTARAVRGEDLCLFGDGSYVRDYVHVDDVIEAFVRAGAQAGTGAINVASGTGTSVSDAFALVADEVLRATGRRVVIRQTSWPATADPIDRRHFVASIERARQCLGWIPAVTLADGVRRLVAQLVDRS